MNINVLNVSDVEIKKDSDGRIIEVVASTTKGTTEIYPVEYDVNKNISKIGHIPVSWGVSVQKELTPLVLNFGQISSIQPFSALVADVVTIDWGDGNSTVYANIDTEENPSCVSLISHSYNNIGDYNITIVFDNLTKIKVSTEILKVFGEFNGCQNANDFNELFAFCFSLEHVSNTLFSKCINLSDISYCFWNCSSLSSIPSTLFNGCQNLTNVSSCFWMCSSLSSIPSTLFNGCQNLINVSNCFNNTGLSTIPSSLFDDCSYINDFSGCFYGCYQLHSIPNGLFNRCPNATDFSGCFAMSGVENIPTDLFMLNINAIDFSMCFNYCVSLYGDAPELWITHSSAMGESCFSGCTNLSNYSSIPNDWK